MKLMPSDRIKVIARTADWESAIKFLKEKYEAHFNSLVIQAAGKKDYGDTREAAGVLKGVQIILAAAKQLGD